MSFKINCRVGKFRKQIGYRGILQMQSGPLGFLKPITTDPRANFLQIGRRCQPSIGEGWEDFY
jgi:hypothetical protein